MQLKNKVALVTGSATGIGEAIARRLAAEGAAVVIHGQESNRASGEAIMREHFRGGQIFYVCPRIEDLDALAERLRNLVPEIKFVMAHGRVTPTQLEKAMTAFYDGSYELLLATNIIESGLDIPTANTIIMHRADMFGLAQLYQLRGRVGRSKLRGYAYLTTPPGKKLTDTAQRRLEVMQTLDQLGAGVGASRAR